MRDANNLSITGNLTADPSFKELSDSCVVEFDIAVNGRKDKTSFFKVKAYNKLAETVSKFCSRGSRVLIVGRIEQSRWERDGQKRSKVEIIASEVFFLTTKKSQSRDEGPGPDHYTAHAEEFDDDSVPF